MKHGIKAVGASILLGLVALSSGPLRAADAPSPDTEALLDQVAALQASLGDLQASGNLSDKSAKSLGKELDRVAEAVLTATEPAESGDVTALLLDPLLRGIQRAIDALLDFIGELTGLVTELPAEVIQPIIDGAIELLRDLFSLLLG